MPIEYEPSANHDHLPLCQRREAGARLPEDALRRRGPDWIQSLGTCPVRFVGDEGWVETGDSGGIEVTAGVAQERTAASAASKVVRARRRRPTPATSSTASSRAKPTAANSPVMRHSHIACHAAALAWILNRKLKFDPAKEAFIGDDEANSLRSARTRSLERVGRCGPSAMLVTPSTLALLVPQVHSPDYRCRPLCDSIRVCVMTKDGDVLVNRSVANQVGTVIEAVTGSRFGIIVRRSGRSGGAVLCS